MFIRSSPATFAFVTGHEFGEATFRAILGLPEYGTKLKCSLLACLDQVKSSVTVGYNDLGPFAAKSEVPIEYIRSIKTEAAQNLLRESAPDYLVIVGWSELAPSAILDIPKSKHRGLARHTALYGCIGMHQTLLPEGRGRAPIPWAIIKGLKRTGVTAFLLEEAADAGGIVDQLPIPIDPTETATTLFEKARLAHFELGARLGMRMAERTLSWTDQDERLASYWPRRRPEDGRIDFSRTAVEIDRFVRALAPPYPGAFFLWADEKILVGRVETLHLAPAEGPGTILETNPSVVVAVKDAAIRLEILEPPRVPLVAGTILA
ncbi:methionyl-tRNA formyltransferase [Enhydrobacter sp.]|jgi:methionyl-tRNA formyltransferase|uniref:methionyl-tRNA formyltransferase n=1 Tax=Enhydrobacter sp. TaxID=1894999 RepID=UPI002602052E|nr:methionyl-tRNA formyltransferase [Enhydrobacter sp.]WIM13718.1 MAG: Methionyl-tRNA formyltransferase [Enhydrobacter sp.]